MAHTGTPTAQRQQAGSAGGPPDTGPGRFASAVAAGLVLLLAWSVLPRPPDLGGEATGDTDLAARVRGLVDGAGRRGLAVAVATPEQIRTAGLGHTGTARDRPVTPTTPFEIGSVAKALTGMLLADLAGTGSIDPGTELAEALPDVSFADPAVADATLAQLAGHRSGLPRLPTGPRVWAWASAGTILGVNPYAVDGGGPGALIATAAATGAARPAGEFGYSNLGGALLGQILARRAGTPYPQLLDDRILAPLGMDDTTVVAGGEPLPDGHAAGHRGNGRPVETWHDTGWAPAGIGVWSTAADLGRLAWGVLAGTAPGAGAARPRFHAGDDDRRVGYGWLTTTYGDGRSVTWHNGGTGGFRSWVGLDRRRDRAVVVLSNTAVGTQELGLELLGVTPPEGDPWWRARTAWLPLALLAMAVIVAARFVWRHRRETVGGDRLGVVTTVAEPTAMLLIAGAIGPWSRLHPAVWLAGLAVVAAAAWIAGRDWRRVQPVGDRSLTAWVWAGTTVLFDTAILLVYPTLTLLR